jgi:hypothetical protein
VRFTTVVVFAAKERIDDSNGSRIDDSNDSRFERPWLTKNSKELSFTLRTAQRILTVGKFASAGKFDDAIQIINHVWGYGERAPKPYTGDDEWYTPAEYVERVRRVLGGIDLDPASNKRGATDRQRC